MTICLSILSIRILILLIGHYIIPLPGSTDDALGFERTAWQLGKNGFFDLLTHFDFGPFVFFSWLHAIPYSLFGRSLLMAKSFSLLFGMGSVLLGLKLASLLWNNSIARKVGWAIALFPSLIFASLYYKISIKFLFMSLRLNIFPQD